MMRIGQIPITIPDIKVPCHSKNIVNVDLNIFKIFQGYLMLIWININNEENNAVVKEQNEINIPMIYNVFSKRKTKLSKLNINIYDYSWMFIITSWMSWEIYP